MTSRLVLVFLVGYISEYVFWIVNHLGMTLGQLIDSVMGNTFWTFFMVWSTGSYFQVIFTLSTNWKQPKSNYDKLFPVDTRRRFNVDTTWYRRWNDVACLLGWCFTLLKVCKVTIKNSKYHQLNTGKNTVISPDFLVWKFCGRHKSRKSGEITVFFGV